MVAAQSLSSVAYVGASAAVRLR